MTLSSTRSEERANVRERLDALVQEYRRSGDVPHLLSSLATLAAASPTAELAEAVESYREMHEVAGPLFEVIVEREPRNARALVALANAYWLTGRGPEAVAELASRALAADPANRGAWHLWALTEPSPRGRVQRWQQVVARFPEDELAMANLADNAASLAGAEDDPVALKLAIATYESLLATASQPEQTAALERALGTLRNWPR
jgi:thioredoxin-like negative regulator of GroEL